MRIVWVTNAEECMMEVLATTKEKVRINLSENIKRLRKQRGWDQFDLAAEARLSQPGIAGYEQLKRFPKPKELESLAKALRTTPGKLLEDTTIVEAQKEPQEQTREQLFAALVEKAIHLDKDGLALLLAALDAGLSDSDCEPMSRLKNDK